MLAPSWLSLRTKRKRACPTSQNHTQGNMPLKLASSWLYVGSMLALCWLMLAPCWLMLGQVASKMAPYGSKLAQVGLKMPLCWLKLASRCPKWLSIAKLHQFLTKNCSFWNALDLQNIEKTIGFIGPFASCTFLFLLMLFEPLSWLKLAPSWLKLANLSKIEPKLSQVGSKLAQVGSKLGPSWLHVGSSWAHVGAKLAPS